MSGVRRLLAVLTVAAGLAAPSLAEPEATPLRLEEFTDMTLSNSLRSQINSDRLRAARWGWQASLRNLTLPKMSVAATRSRSGSDDDAGTKTESTTNEGALTLQQPFLTGTSLSASSTWTDEKTDTTFGDLRTPATTVSRPALTASLIQPLYLFVGNSALRSRREAMLTWDNAQDAYRSEWLDIRFTARSLYDNLILLSETAAVERKKFESAQLLNQATEALVREGKLAKVQLARADVRAQSDRRRVQNAETTYLQNLNQARDLAGLPKDKPLTLTSHLSEAPFIIPLETLISFAEENNPALRIARRQVELAGYDLRQTSESDRPKLNANGTYAKTMNRSSGTPPLDPSAWQIGVGLDWAFYDASQTALRVKQGRTAVDNAKRAAQDQERQLRVAIENLYIDLKHAEEQISTFGVQRAVAERNVTATRLQYRNGIALLTDVFDAENERRDIELEYLGLLVNYNLSQDRLAVLVGKDFNEFPGGKK